MFEINEIIMGVQPRIVKANYVRDYIVYVEFDDGLKGEMDLEDELEGEVFEPLNDQEYFQSFRVDPDIHTLVWDNGADFAPEYLREKLTKGTDERRRNTTNKIGN